jgi:hypothetical protein
MQRDESHDEPVFAYHVPTQDLFHSPDTTQRLVSFIHRMSVPIHSPSRATSHLACVVVTEWNSAAKTRPKFPTSALLQLEKRH